MVSDTMGQHALRHVPVPRGLRGTAFQVMRGRGPCHRVTLDQGPGPFPSTLYLSPSPEVQGQAWGPGSCVGLRC